MTRLRSPSEAGGTAIDSCDACLRRGYLLGRLAAPIARLLDRPARREARLLALGDHDLVSAVASDRVDEETRFLDGFEATIARRHLRERALGAICRHSAFYPRPLLDVTDAPAVLFVAGSPAPLIRLTAEPAVALVGTRRPSPYGLEMAYALGRGLGAAGVTVVSGLALGVDAAAHRGCLDACGTGVAVLAGGPDVPYPRTNAGLYERMVATGSVISELPPGQRAFRWAFPARNRIMAGLAQIVVVVEAAEPSGSLITSTFAEQLGRTVGAVPGRATARLSEGNNRLLKDGALVVTCARDLLDELYGVEIDAAASGSGAALAGAAETERDSAPARSLGAVEQRALDAVEAGLGIDGVCANASLPAREARALLARLEAGGHLRRDGLGGYRRTAAIGR